MMKPRNQKIVVLGAGSAGLAAAWELVDRGQNQVLVLERASVVGGLLASVEKNGNQFEYGTHVFHTNIDSLRDRVKSLMGERLFEFDRMSKLHIKFRDKYFRYPLNGMDIVLSLPLHLSLHCVLSMLYSNIAWKIQGREPANAAEVLRQRFGDKLYEIFFKDYTHKFWGMPCEELDKLFSLERIPRSDIFKIVHDIFEKLGLSNLNIGHPLAERAIGKLYYAANGIHELTDTMAAHIENNGGKIETNTRLSRICLENNTTRIEYFIDGKQESVEADYIVSTIPIRHLIPLFNKPPDREVMEASDRLQFLPLTVCGLLVKRKPIREAFCTYFRELIFNRLSEPTNQGLRTVPEGRSILLAEITDYSLQQYNVKTEDEIYHAVVKDLVRENLIREDEIEDSCVFRYEEAYPIYHLGFQQDIAIIKDYLRSLGNVFTTGRQGNFCYVNTHIAMQMGIETTMEIPS
ncbi:MAG: FAD-dependent oxidoreductase [Negativicutes bacterium]|nr:FAD-dependent oxidoreductase [Negativicutes bacterium]